MKLSENIRNLRKSKGLTQEKLAEQLHTTRQSVSKWEQGNLEPNIQMLIRLADYFGVTLDELVLDENEMKNDKNVENEHYKSMNFFEFISQKWWLVIIILLIISGTLSQIFN